MDDVFGGLAGGPGDADRSRRDLSALDEVLDGGSLLGLELEPRFRVLALTVEPTVERYPWGAPGDRRLQVLCFPVSTILASLRREGHDGRELLAFTEEQLPDVANAVAGAALQGPVFGRPEPRPGTWGPRMSLEGRSSAPDGTSRTVTVAVRDDDLALDLFARVDDVEVRDPAGQTLELPS